jgi:hypothetical protein
LCGIGAGRQGQRERGEREETTSIHWWIENPIPP